MAISIPILVLPSDELLIKLRFKAPFIPLGVKRSNDTVIFTNCIDFALLTKESIAPILTQKSEGMWVSGISETNYPILVCKTGSRLRENFGGSWKIFRGSSILENIKRIG